MVSSTHSFMLYLRYFISSSGEPNISKIDSARFLQYSSNCMFWGFQEFKLVFCVCGASRNLHPVQDHTFWAPAVISQTLAMEETSRRSSLPTVMAKTSWGECHV